jgi:ABC-type glycerol-3-phosphate transport system permease component
MASVAPAIGAPSAAPFYSFRRVSGRALLYALVLLNLVVLLLPVLWLVSTAFKTRADVLNIPPAWFPPSPTLEAFRLLAQTQVPVFFLNSIIVAVGTAILATTAGALAAYGFVRVRFRFSETVLLLVLASIAFPMPLMMMSIYQGMRDMGLLDTYVSLILGHTILTLPVVVWLLRGFFEALPVEVEEAAFIDGASLSQVLRLVVFPMARPGLSAAAIYVFVTSWNEFIFGLTFTSRIEMRPLPAGISLLFLQEMQFRWPEMMAVAVMATLPILLLFLLFQRNFIEGMTTGAVKG